MSVYVKTWWQRKKINLIMEAGNNVCVSALAYPATAWWLYLHLFNKAL